MPLDLAQFQKTLIYQHSGTISEICADLLELSQFDALHERLRSRWGWSALALVPIGLVSAFVSSPLNHASMPALVWLGVCFAAIVVCVVQWIRHRRADLANRRYELANEVLRLLERDSSKEATINLRLDLRSPNHASKKQRDGTIGVWKVKYFVDPWLDLSGRFLDGTSYRLIGVEKFQARKKSYRSRSGKYKSKSKTKSSTQVTLSLKPSAKRYAEIEQIGTKLDAAVQLPNWASSRSVGAANGRVFLTTMTKSDWSGQPRSPKSTGNSGPHLVAMMFLSLYQALNQSRVARA
ncbi:MAG: hypothetical protein ACKV2Q_28670 [Planctomycetaceae bacterium]